MANCPLCKGPLPEPAPTGRPKMFCSVACRRSAEHELRRIQTRLMRLENEAENARRDRSGLLDAVGGTREERAADIAREIERAEERLRILLAA